MQNFRFGRNFTSRGNIFNVPSFKENASQLCLVSLLSPFSSPERSSVCLCPGTLFHIDCVLLTAPYSEVALGCIWYRIKDGSN